MKKYIIIFLHIGLFHVSNAQNDSIRSLNIWYDNRIINFDIGIKQINTPIITMGVSMIRQNVLSYYTQSLNFLYAPGKLKGASYHIDFALSGVSLGLGTTGFFTDTISDYRLNLLGGMNLLWFRIYYSRNINIYGESSEFVNRNSISVVFALPVIERLNIKKYKYKRKYRKYVNENSKYVFSWK